MRGNLKSRLNAWGLEALDGYMHRSYGKMKRSMLADHADVVLEIGAGTGSNLKYYRKGTKVIAVEPGLAMRERLIRSADKHGIDLHLIETGIENAPIEENSIDFAMTSLVLCTVADIHSAAKKIHHVLKPGGRYVFLEHVAGEEGSLVRRVQDSLHGPWHYLFEGCHTNRDIESVINNAGFNSVEIKNFNLKVPDLIPVKPHIIGTAVK